MTGFKGLFSRRYSTPLLTAPRKREERQSETAVLKLGTPGQKGEREKKMVLLTIPLTIKVWLGSVVLLNVLGCRLTH